MFSSICVAEARIKNDSVDLCVDGLREEIGEFLLYLAEENDYSEDTLRVFPILNSLVVEEYLPVEKALFVEQYLNRVREVYYSQ